jgi:hypothetical protein
MIKVRAEGICIVWFEAHLDATPTEGGLSAGKTEQALKTLRPLGQLGAGLKIGEVEDKRAEQQRQEKHRQEEFDQSKTWGVFPGGQSD